MGTKRLKDHVTTEVMKAAPPMAVSAFTLNHMVAFATLCYILLQAAYLIWKWRRDIRNDNQSKIS